MAVDGGRWGCVAAGAGAQEESCAGAVLGVDGGEREVSAAVFGVDGGRGVDAGVDAGADVARPAVANVMEQSGAAVCAGAVSRCDADGRRFITAHALRHWLPVVLLAVWVCGALVVRFAFGRGWWRVYARSGRRRGFHCSPLRGTRGSADVPVLCSSALIEPGIFGIFRPVLLLPEGILERLTAEQLRAIVAHEMCHVRRRDNLTFAVHMIVETLFWFHPRGVVDWCAADRGARTGLR